MQTDVVEPNLIDLWTNKRCSLGQRFSFFLSWPGTMLVRQPLGLKPGVRTLEGRIGRKANYFLLLLLTGVETLTVSTLLFFTGKLWALTRPLV